MAKGLLASTNMDLDNAALPQDVRDKISRDNTKALQASLQKAGINELFNIKNSTQTNISNASFQTILGFEAAFSVSGGYVRAKSKVSIALDDGEIFSVRLLLDGVAVDNQYYSVTGGGIRLTSEVEYDAFMPVGNHTFSVQVLTNGTIETNGQSTCSSFIATETLV